MPEIVLPQCIPIAKQVFSMPAYTDTLHARKRGMGQHGTNVNCINALNPFACVRMLRESTQLGNFPAGESNDNLLSP